jgi:uncharacterized protein involved in cysteine biosynthesis
MSSSVPGRPNFLRRAAEGAWHVPGGIFFLFRNPPLLPLALLPAFLALLGLAFGALLGLVLGPGVAARVAPSPERVWPGIAVAASLILWAVTIGAGIVLGLAVALLLAAPVLDLLSQRVEARLRGRVDQEDRGWRFELSQSLRGALYFLVAAPGVFLLGLIPFVGPVLAWLWGARALAYQFTDSALSRRGLAFRDKRAWLRRWLFETEGFGLAGMVVVAVPPLTLLLGPALAVGGTLLVLELEDLARAEGPAARA